MEPSQVQLSSTYPSAPKEYFELYTNENIKAGRAPPPPPVVKDNYSTFGKFVNPNDVLIRSLESQGIQRLYKTPAELAESGILNKNHHKSEMKKLNHSILIAYLDLLDILVKAPNTPLPDEELPIDPENQLPILKTLRQQKLEDIELLFINMHHMINELRPHQARDNIRCILEMQKHQRMVIAQKFRVHLHKIVDLLKKCIQSIQTPTSSASGSARLASFLDELKMLMKNANDLTKCLGKFDSNGSTTSEAKNEATSDVSMDVAMETSDKKCENENKQESNSNESKSINQNCDLNDEILCDLIDDFLIKENEH